MGQFFLQNFVPFLIAPIYWLLTKTWRIRELGPPQVLAKFVQTKDRAPCIFAHWHGDELVLVGYYAHRRLAVLSSLSKDGSIMARTCLRVESYGAIGAQIAMPPFLVISEATYPMR